LTGNDEKEKQSNSDQTKGVKELEKDKNVSEEANVVKNEQVKMRKSNKELEISRDSNDDPIEKVWLNP